ncbi:ATP-dependent DNA helicase [Candidatus Woesearchaeota archaeon]|nr:ATP-dependent DNA helicase [Candidatus Woesearchaeota archaeon]
MAAFPRDFFSHQQVRPGQEKFLEDAHNAFTEGKIILAHAPTGLGKTACALSMAVWHALEKKKKVFFLTNRHTQHRIAIETLQSLEKRSGKKIPCIDIIGKRWMCSHDVAGMFGKDFMDFCKTIVERGECEFYSNVYQSNKVLTPEVKLALSNLNLRGPMHNEEIISYAQEKRFCGYELSLALAKKAQVIIADYNYLFNPFVRNAFLSKLELEQEDIFVIVDEAHNLPARVTDMLSSALSTLALKYAIQESKKFGYAGLVGWLQKIDTLLLNLRSSSEQRLVGKEEFIAKVNAIHPYDDLINELELAAEEIRKKQRKSYLGGISAFLESWRGEDEGYARIFSEKKGKYGTFQVLSYDCLDPSKITKDIFATLPAGLLMSGTLKPLTMYQEVLGIEKKKAVLKEYGSPFPPENKLTLLIPETSTKYSVRSDTMYQQIAQKCSELAELIPGNVAFFFPSYSVRDHVGTFLRMKKRLFWEKNDMSKEEKELLLAEFKAAREKGGILLGVAGANFAEGVDFPGDLLQGVVVVGLPLGKPDLKTQELISYYDKKFGKGWDYGYIFPAMSKCIQSAGRCIRSETDRGVVVYLDERFAWERYYNCFPDKVGLRVTKKYEEMIKEFFGN